MQPTSQIGVKKNNPYSLAGATFGGQIGKQAGGVLEAQQELKRLGYNTPEDGILTDSFLTNLYAEQNKQQQAGVAAMGNEGWSKYRAENLRGGQNAIPGQTPSAGTPEANANIPNTQAAPLDPNAPSGHSAAYLQANPQFNQTAGQLQALQSNQYRPGSGPSISSPEGQANIAALNNNAGPLDPNTPSGHSAAYLAANPQFNKTAGQMEAINAGITSGAGINPTTGITTPTTGTSDLEGQYKALLGQSPEELAAQKAIDDKNNSLTQGKFNVSQQPIADSFISGQQAAMQTQSDIAKVPLQQQLANAQAKRQAALDSVKFSLEREDKSKQSALDEAYRTAVLNKPKENAQPTSVEEYNFAKSQGYKGSYIDYQNDDANRKATVAKAGAVSVNLPSSQNVNTKETADALMSVNQISNVLDMPDFNSAFGPKGIVNRAVPGSPAQTIVALTTQILDKAAVAARGQLKGQGQVSNFEVQMLKNAQSSLSNYQIAPPAARQALIDMQGAIQTSTGGDAKVILTDKKTGQTLTRYLNSREITKAIADGAQVKYIK